MGLGISKEDQQAVNEFVEAARLGDLDKVRRLKDQELNGKNESGDTALHAAALNGHLAVCAELLQDARALERDARDSDMATPLMLACNGGHLEIAQRLVRLTGAKPGLVDVMGWTPLHHACSNGHATVVRFLLDRLPREAYFQLDSAGCSPLWLSASSGDAETTRLMLCHGGNPLECNFEGVSVQRAVESKPPTHDEDEEESDYDELELVTRMVREACEVWTVELAALAAANAAAAEGGEVNELLGKEDEEGEGGHDGQQPSQFAKQGMADEGPGLYEYDEDDPPQPEQVQFVRQRTTQELLRRPLFNKCYLPSLFGRSSPQRQHREAPPLPAVGGANDDNISMSSDEEEEEEGERSPPPPPPPSRFHL